MKHGIVAFAFGVPNTLGSNRLIAEAASCAARNFHCPIFTQIDVLPVAQDVAFELVEERPPQRVPTLRIARGAVLWAQRLNIEKLSIVAAEPHWARCNRDLHRAVNEKGAAIEIEIAQFEDDHPDSIWFCDGSLQLDTRFRIIWQVRDAILMHLPMQLYALIAG